MRMPNERGPTVDDGDKDDRTEVERADRETKENPRTAEPMVRAIKVLANFMIEV